MADGLKLIVSPLGEFADRETVPLNPFCAENVIPVVAVEPCCMVRRDGLMLREKSGCVLVVVMLMLDAVLVLPV